MTARRLVGWWLALFALWFALVGEWTWLVAVWGAGLSLLAAAAGVVVTAQGRFRAGFRLPWLRELGAASVAVVTDTVLVATVLVRCVAGGRHRHGRFVRDRSAAGDDEVAVGRRAWVEALASWSPNSYVIDVSPEDGERLLHDLARRRSSESPS